jgi:DNA-binding NarL/FixJ family response regulator
MILRLLTHARSLRVAIAGSNADLLLALRDSLDAGPSIVVCAEASDGRTALRVALEERPDVWLVTDEPGFDAVGVVEALVEHTPHASVVLSGEEPDDETLMRAVAIGASGYVPSGLDGARLAAALFDGVSGQTAFPERLAALLIARLRDGSGARPDRQA